MAKKIYSYPFPGFEPNFEALDVQISASSLQGFQSVKAFDREIQVKFEQSLSADDELQLDAIIAAHDGSPSRTTKSLNDGREAILRKIVDMAHAHPVLSDNNAPASEQKGDDVITAYLTYIDNYFNAWKRDGNPQILIDKIIADSQSGDYVTFLNHTVSPPTAELPDGGKTFQFLISQIPTTPYI